jgi:hypothetical protein
MLTTLGRAHSPLNDRKDVGAHRNDTTEQASRRYGSEEVA